MILELAISDSSFLPSSAIFKKMGPKRKPGRIRYSDFKNSFYHRGNILKMPPKRKHARNVFEELGLNRVLDVACLARYSRQLWKKLFDSRI
jgi:hypothetical protein